MLLSQRRAPHGLDKPGSRPPDHDTLPFDVLIVQDEPRSFVGRMVQALHAGI